MQPGSAAGVANRAISDTIGACAPNCLFVAVLLRLHGLAEECDKGVAKRAVGPGVASIYSIGLTGS